MSKYAAYSEYKDSGVEWLGEVPKHWMFTELKRYSSVQGGYAFSSDSFVDSGRAVIRIGDIKQDGSVSLDSCKYIENKDSASHSQYEVTDGDLLMAMTGATIGKAGWYKEKESALLNQRVGSFKCNEEYLNYKFFWYVLNSAGYQEYITLTAFGGAQPNISDAGMVGYQSAFPPEEEQEKIANFLDHETAKIDTLIEKQQQLIKLLKEKRQAVISHAVTKGLPSPTGQNIPMRDSGVEWLGEVPAHWLASSLGYYATISTGATPDRSKSQYWDGDIPWIKTGEVKYDEITETEERITSDGVANSAVTLSPPGTLLMAMYGQGVTRGRVALLGISATYNQACAAITPNEHIRNEYLRYFFMAAYHAIRDGGNETSQMNLNADIVSKFKVTIPDMDEQHKIVEFLDVELKTFDVLIDKAMDAIELMQERRTALISAAVTGKIDVRGWIAPEPNTNNKEVAE